MEGLNAKCCLNSVMLRLLNYILVPLAILPFCSTALEWWEVGPVYQIYPASFADSDDDGWGDLKGIQNHVDHFVDIGVAAVWISPIFASPMRDNGYDVSNYTLVNPIFGTITDFDNLKNALHEKGIKLLLDFVPNHTSNESTWFIDSINRRNGKDDWYVWMDPKLDADGNRHPPNNWVSNFNGPAWTYNEKRGQYYFHQFGDYQPDLNYYNTDVQKAVGDCLKYWLDRGLDGYRMDAVPYLGESNYTSDEPQIAGCNDENSSNCYEHIYTQNQEITFEVLKQFNDIAASYPHVGLFLEAYEEFEILMKYYGTVSSPFNFQYVSYFNIDTDAKTLDSITTQYLNSLPSGAWPNWVVGNHDNSRVGTRMGADMIDAMNMVTTLLPGTCITYNGEELGMVDTHVRNDQRRDLSSDRDPERTPMQWNRELNAGFSKSKSPYLPVNPNYWELNVEDAKTAESSHLSIYKKLVALHKELINTTLDGIETKVISTWVWAFKRAGYVVVINLNNEYEYVSLESWTGIPETIYVEIPPLNSVYAELDSVSSKNISMFPRSGIVLKLTAPSPAPSSAVLIEIPMFLFFSSAILAIKNVF